jgi:hypothetical protein
MPFSPGLRISFLDVIVLAAGAWGTWFVGHELWWAGAVIGFVVGHFFLFCNVFRIARKPELLWAGAFVALCGSTILTDLPGWTVTFAGSVCLTLILILREMKKPSYHGILWRRVNPELPQWWASHHEAPHC